MKDKIYGIIMGVVIAVCAYHVYFVYTLKKTVNVHQATLTQIVNLINESQKKTTPAQ